MYRNYIIGLAGIIACVASPPAYAKKKSAAWNVTRTADPITGATSCVVAAYDRFASLRYSRTGYLYPIVENNSELGLLVGVSSGGTFRMPTGDMIWRVDGLAFREIKAADNPPGRTIALAKTGNELIDKSMTDAMALTAGLMATSTVARGEKARAMLAEMMAGTTLIFRQAQAVQSFGLPDSGAYRVGQLTNKGLRPYPLDQSFRDGLASCGVQPPTPPGND